MKPKRQRLTLILLGMLALAGATALVLTAFEDNLVFFYSPSDIQAEPPPEGRNLRVGGLVLEGSVEKLADGAVRFTLSDTANELPVVFAGILPDLFREGQGIVAEGRFGPEGVFHAEEVLAKHDENYMPPEVAEALEKSGEWQRGQEPEQGQ
ncbi:MAG: cytochrome c maturation protein CcmE [Rhodovibrionaceae bacterium]